MKTKRSSQKTRKKALNQIRAVFSSRLGLNMISHKAKAVKIPKNLSAPHLSKDIDSVRNTELNNLLASK